MRYLDTQLRSAPPEYVFGILNEELARLLLQLQAVLDSSPGSHSDLREKIETILEELVRAVESRPGTPFTELSDLYRSFQKLVVTSDSDLGRNLPEMTALLVDLIGKLRPDR